MPRKTLDSRVRGKDGFFEAPAIAGRINNAALVLRVRPAGARR